MKTKERKIELKMPRWGLPLYGQILAWFFVNVIVVSLVFWIVLKIQFGIDLGQFLANQLRDEVESRSELIAGELKESPREDWDGILKRFGKGAGLQLAILTEDGRWVNQDNLPVSLRKLALEEIEKGPPEKDGRDFSKPSRGDDKPGATGSPEDDFFFPNGADREGELSGPPIERPRMGPPPRNPDSPPLMVFSQRSEGKGNSQRWAAVRVHLAGNRYRHSPIGLLVFYSDGSSKDEVFVDFRPLIFVGVCLIVLSGVMWLPFVLRVTKRLRVMTEGAERISEGDFDVNLASRRGDELGRLSRVIQRMAERLSLLVDGQKRFLGDTAHELCSPLARMRMGLGVLEQRLEGGDRERLVAVEEEVSELARLVDELLDFSKASLAKNQEKFELLFYLRALRGDLPERIDWRDLHHFRWTRSGNRDQSRPS